MKLSALAVLVIVAALLMAFPVRGDSRHVWFVASPDHEQTFAYGSEQNRIWTTRGANRHLALLLDFTNDPYVDQDNPRQCDNFTFDFPNVTLGRDGRTFYFRTSDGRSLAVAAKQPDLFGVEETHLLPASRLVIEKPHGYLSLTLVVRD